MFGMTKYLLLAALAAIIGLGAYVWYLERQITPLKNKLAITQLQYSACSARLDNIRKDKASDAEIDKIPDGDLRVVPDGWMLP